MENIKKNNLTAIKYVFFILSVLTSNKALNSSAERLPLSAKNSHIRFPSINQWESKKGRPLTLYYKNDAVNMQSLLHPNGLEGALESLINKYNDLHKSDKSFKPFTTMEYIFHFDETDLDDQHDLATQFNKQFPLTFKGTPIMKLLGTVAFQNNNSKIDQTLETDGWHFDNPKANFKHGEIILMRDPVKIIDTATQTEVPRSHNYIYGIATYQIPENMPKEMYEWIGKDASWVLVQIDNEQTFWIDPTYIGKFTEKKIEQPAQSKPTAPETVTPESKSSKSDVKIEDLIKQEVPQEALQIEVIQKEALQIEVIQTPETIATHAILTFLDDSEQSMQALTQFLLYALNQKAGPILVSTSLFLSIQKAPSLLSVANQKANAPMIHFNNYLQKIRKKISELIDKKFDAQQISAELNKELSYASNTYPGNTGSIAPLVFKTIYEDNFHWNDWIVKSVDSSKNLLLFIPKNYKNKNYALDMAEYKPSSKLPLAAPLTETEYKIGLKIDHMETVTEEQSRTLQATKFDNADYFVTSLWPRRNIKDANSSDIFVSRAEYTRAKQYKTPRWAIFMCGHGWPNKLISFLSIQSFSDVLDFLETKINTSLLAYHSCFSSGTNTKLIYDDIKKQSAKTFSFAIAMHGVTDTPQRATVGFILPGDQEIDTRMIDMENKNLALTGDSDYKSFIDNVTTMNFSNLAQAILPILKLESGFIVPQIRLAGKEWFNIEDVQNNIALIGNTFAKTCKIIDLNKYFARVDPNTKKSRIPKFYFLYAPIIPCELKLPAGFSPIFIPMASAKKPNSDTFIYYIQKVSSDKSYLTHESALNDILTMFTSTLPGYYSMQLWIKNLFDWYSDVVIEVKPNINNPTQQDAVVYLTIMSENKPYMFKQYDRLKSLEKDYKQDLQSHIGKIEDFAKERTKFKPLEDIVKKKSEEVNKKPGKQTP